MARATALDRQLSALIDQFAPLIRAAFLTAIQGVKDQTIISELVTAIQDGDPNKAFEVLGFNNAAMRPLTAMLEQAFEVGGVTMASGIPPLPGKLGGRTVFRFDVKNSRAEAWLRDHSSQLITRLSEEQRVAVMNTMQAGVAEGRNPRNVALDIVGRVDPVTGRRTGGIIGLNRPQEIAVARARSELLSDDPTIKANYFTRTRRDARFDSTVQKSIDTDTALDAETVNKLTGRYSDSLLQLRGETVGRTEALTSLNTSQDETMQQVIDTGAVSVSQVTSEWDSSGNDGRTRPDHLAMEGQTVPWGQPFIAPDGSQLMFPGDTSLGAAEDETINCRCRRKIKINFLAGVS